MELASTIQPFVDSDKSHRALAGARLHVFRCAHGAPPAEHGRDAASVLTFEVDSLAAAMSALRDRGVRFLHEAPAANPGTGLLYAAFEGPGGVVHELVQRR